MQNTDKINIVYTYDNNDNIIYDKEKVLIKHFNFMKISFHDLIKKASKYIFGFSDAQIDDDILYDQIDAYWKYTPKEIINTITILLEKQLPQFLPKLPIDIKYGCIERKILYEIHNGHHNFLINDIPSKNKFISIKNYNIYNITDLTNDQLTFNLDINNIINSTDVQNTLNNLNNNDKLISKAIIIGITGRKRSGKDTIGNYLVKKYNFKRIAFADSLKQFCKLMFGLSDDQVHNDILKEQTDTYWNYSPREILQIVGTELLRDSLSTSLQNISKNIWINSVEIQIMNNIKNGHDKCIITDVRFPNELDFIRNNNGRIWKVIRPSIMNENQKYSYHASEVSIDQFVSDHIFINDGTIQDLLYKLDNAIVP